MTDSNEYWYNPADSQLGKWQRQLEDVSGSPTFCVLPWIHFATRPNGDMRLCCSANASGAATGDHEVGLVKMEDGKPANFARNTPMEAWNNGSLEHGSMEQRAVREEAQVADPIPSCQIAGHSYQA